MAKDLWTREQLILALNLYLKIPFGRINRTTPEVIQLGNLIGRNANAVSMRLSNFASVDPYHQQRGIKGLEGGKKQVQPIWDEFINNKEALLFESERILAEKERIPLEAKYPDAYKGLDTLKGETKIREVKTRVNQNVFRQIVLNNYQNRCAISEIAMPQLLLASHILPWSTNEAERLNPQNGICLSALYDRAFDKGLITISDDFKVILSKTVKQENGKEYFNTYFGTVEGKKLLMPEDHPPSQEFLSFHRGNIFLGQ